MILSRKWLNEFVDVSDISDREFDEAMTLSGSKVETVTALDIDPQYGLVVRHGSGAVETLRCGEVSVRGLYGYAE